MAGENKHWYESPPITTLAGAGLLLVGVPDGVGGWVTNTITKTNLIKELQAEVNALEVTSTGIVKTMMTNLDGVYPIVIAANTKLLSIEIKKIGGNPYASFYTNNDYGTDLMVETEVTSNGLTFNMPDVNVNTRTFYVYVDGGQCDLAILTLPNIF